MAEDVTLSVNGKRVRAPAGSVLAVALTRAGEVGFRRSISGQPRGPLCGMGVCFECCVTIDGRPHQRSCLALCKEGMEVQTHG
jgi:sarcosine oxidase subunit alpha